MAQSADGTEDTLESSVEDVRGGPLPAYAADSLSWDEILQDMERKQEPTHSTPLAGEKDFDPPLPTWLDNPSASKCRGTFDMDAPAFEGRGVAGLRLRNYTLASAGQAQPK